MMSVLQVMQHTCRALLTMIFSVIPDEVSIRVCVRRLVRFAPSVMSSMGKITWLHPPFLFISVLSGSTQHFSMTCFPSPPSVTNRNTTISNTVRFNMVRNAQILPAALWFFSLSVTNLHKNIL